MTTLDDYLALAASYDGVTAANDPERFGTVCAPNGPPSARAWLCQHDATTESRSPCEVVAVGMATLFFASLGLPYLKEPLDNAAGEWGRFTAFARQHGAYHSPESKGVGIRPGCIVHVEGTSGRHWETVVADLGDGKFRTVEGTLAGGWGIIHCVTRDYRGGVYDWEAGKPVRDWVDVGELLEALLPCVDADPADAPLGAA